jgi:hypothetical protein
MKFFKTTNNFEFWPSLKMFFLPNTHHAVKNLNPSKSGSTSPSHLPMWDHLVKKTQYSHAWAPQGLWLTFMTSYSTILGLILGILSYYSTTFHSTIMPSYFAARAQEFLNNF